MATILMRAILGQTLMPRRRLLPTARTQALRMARRRQLRFRQAVRGAFFVVGKGETLFSHQNHVGEEVYDPSAGRRKTP
jgi:hypothetical protein